MGRRRHSAGQLDLLPKNNNQFFTLVQLVAVLLGTPIVGGGFLLFAHTTSSLYQQKYGRACTFDLFNIGDEKQMFRSVKKQAKRVNKKRMQGACQCCCPSFACCLSGSNVVLIFGTGSSYFSGGLCLVLMLQQGGYATYTPKEATLLLECDRGIVCYCAPLHIRRDQIADCLCVDPTPPHSSIFPLPHVTHLSQLFPSCTLSHVVARAMDIAMQGYKDCGGASSA